MESKNMNPQIVIAMLVVAVCAVVISLINRMEKPSVQADADELPTAVPTPQAK